MQHEEAASSSTPLLAPVGPNERNLFRAAKSITVNPKPGTAIDRRVVSFEYYNSFNYSILTKRSPNANVSLGITSPGRSEGKTLIACNLAVSLSLGYQRRTALVDLNCESPRIHQIFGTALSPGLAESLYDGSVHVSRTTIDELWVISAGVSGGAHIGLGHLAAFRHVIWSLEQEFEFVVVDMPSLSTKGFPILFANQLHGVLVVVNTRRTRRRDVDRVFRQLQRKQVVGFVFNRVHNNDI